MGSYAAYKAQEADELVQRVRTLEAENEALWRVAEAAIEHRAAPPPITTGTDE